MQIERHKKRGTLKIVTRLGGGRDKQFVGNFLYVRIENEMPSI